MNHVLKPTQKVIDVLTEGLSFADGGGYRKIDNHPARSGMMALSVEFIGPETVAIAHRYEQNGDLIPDPEMTFWRGPDKIWYPATVAQAITGGRERVALRLDENGQPDRVDRRLQKELAGFAAIWMRNVVAQQFDGKLPSSLTTKTDALQQVKIRL